RILARLDLALRQRPGALVAPGPERAARVDEQHLEPACRPAVEQQPCALLRRHARYPVARRRSSITTAARRRGSPSAGVVARRGDRAPGSRRPTAQTAGRRGAKLARLREAEIDLARGGVGPAARDDLAPRVEVNALRAVDVAVAEERRVPAAER